MTLACQINEMGTDTEEQLCDFLPEFPFSLQVDETTTSDKNEMAEEFLFIKYLETDTKGQTIFNVLHAYLQEKSIPMTNILTCATDGVASMVGKYRGFTTLLKEQVPNGLTVQRVLHCHNIVAKSKTPPLHEYLNVAVKSIKKKIRGHGLNGKLCQENDKTFEHLLLHTEVHWLSKGNCLACFCELSDSIVEFLEEVDAALGEKVLSSRCDIIQCKAVIHSMNSRLDFYRQSIGRRHFTHFPQLSSLSNINTTKNHNYISLTAQHLHHCLDLLDLDVRIWVVQPFQVDMTECGPAIQERLVDIQSNDEAKAIFHTSGWGSMGAKYAKRNRVCCACCFHSEKYHISTVEVKMRSGRPRKLSERTAHKPVRMANQESKVKLLASQEWWLGLVSAKAALCHWFCS
uniref:DUF4371 domain-containing protein n=1 Tax=Mola mola TaxID=94237 RepID=A0A3Q3WKI0_MOLML